MTRSDANQCSIVNKQAHVKTQFKFGQVSDPLEHIKEQNTSFGKNQNWEAPAPGTHKKNKMKFEKSERSNKYRGESSWEQSLEGEMTGKGGVIAVTHYHVKQWIDQFPIYTEKDFKELDKVIRELYSKRKGKSTPSVVHCKGGIGRSCTFICLFYVFQKLKSTRQFGLMSRNRAQIFEIAETRCPERSTTERVCACEKHPRAEVRRRAN